MTNRQNENRYEKSKQDMINKTYQYAKEYNVDMSNEHPAWNDSADAFRHAYMQAALTVNYTYPVASMAGDAHEFIGNIKNNQDPRENNMDTWNNAVGREIGLEVKNEIKGKNYSQQQIDDLIARKTYERLQAGELITDINDKRDYKRDYKNRKNLNSVTNPVTRLDGRVELNVPKSSQYSYNIPDNKVYTFEEIGKMKPEEFRLQQERILSDFVNRKMLHDYEAAEKVQSGELIYVQPYERADGTKVEGYYRRK